jgi:hypothetical protein
MGLPCRENSNAGLIPVSGPYVKKSRARQRRYSPTEGELVGVLLLAKEPSRRRRGVPNVGILTGTRKGRDARAAGIPMNQGYNGPRRLLRKSKGRNIGNNQDDNPRARRYKQHKRQKGKAKMVLTEKAKPRSVRNRKRSRDGRGSKPNKGAGRDHSVYHD